MDLNQILYQISVWLLPVLLAITLHEAGHAYAARLFGDNTAWLLGRVSLNPAKHIDPVGTILIPGLLLLARSPFIFGYAKPVPVDFRALRPPRLGMVGVALAGPLANILLATLAALLFHTVQYLPDTFSGFVRQNLQNAIVINVVLAVFNMLPIPPLDGGRVAVGLLPRALARPLADLEPYGFFIVLGLIFFLPILGQAVGQDLNVVNWFIRAGANALLAPILTLTGNA